MFDTAIIGTGPAGISAALTLKSLNRSILLFGTKQLSGKIRAAEKIRNYPGLPMVTGMEMRQAFSRQLEEMDIPITEKTVTGIYHMGTHYSILCDQDMFEARTVILCTGVESVKPIEGELEFVGRGVSYCATCDGMLYREKAVAVLGYSDTARHEAEFLAGLGCSVTYFDRPRTCAITGGERVTAVTCDGQTAEVEGVFLLRPTMAPTDLFPGLAVEGGYVTVNRKMETNLAGVFAAGDCTGGPLQVSKAAGDGLVAGQSAAAYVAALARKENV